MCVKSYKDYDWYNGYDFLINRNEVIDELVRLRGEKEVIEKIELEYHWIINHPTNIGKTPPSENHINSFLKSVLRRINKSKPKNSPSHLLWY